MLFRRPRHKAIQRPEVDDSDTQVQNSIDLTRATSPISLSQHFSDRRLLCHLAFIVDWAYQNETLPSYKLPLVN